jgi:nitronate monooxygenase
MNFGSGGSSKAKAWKDIWGAGQGVGSVDDIPAIDDLVKRMEQEYREAQQRLVAG